MKELIVYYSFTGKTKKVAEELAKATNASLCEVIEIKKRRRLTAFIPGAFQAMTCKKAKIYPLLADMNKFDKIIFAAPIWASYPAPAINGAIDLLPENKEIELILLSSSGKSTSEKTVEMIKSKNCKVVAVKNIGTSTKK